MIRIRPATAEDIEAMAAVHAAGWEQGFAGIVPPELTPSLETLAERMRERPGERLVAEIDGEVRGFCTFGPSRDADGEARVADIYVLFVDPRAWRGGVGKALVHQALAELEKAGYDQVTLWSAAENARANDFYERLGFSLDGAEQTRESFGKVREIRYRRDL